MRMLMKIRNISVIVICSILLLGLTGCSIYKDFLKPLDYLYPISVDDKFGYIDKSGKIVIQPKYDSVGYFSEGLAPVLVGNKYGYIDTKGKFIINPKYNDASDFSEGLAQVLVGDKYGYIDKKGEFAIYPQYEEVLSFSEGLAAVEINGKWGFINKSGDYEINPKFDLAESFSEGLAIAGYNKDNNGIDQNLGYINKKGEFAIKPTYKDVYRYSFNSDLAAIMPNCNFIDKKGKVVLDLSKKRFNALEDGQCASFNNGLLLVHDDEWKNWWFVDTQGNIKIKVPAKDDIDSGLETGPVGSYSEGLAIYYSSGKWGFIDEKGSIAIKPLFDYGESFKNGLAKVGIGNKEGYINKEGKFVWYKENKVISDDAQVTQPFEKSQPVEQPENQVSEMTKTAINANTQSSVNTHITKKTTIISKPKVVKKVVRQPEPVDDSENALLNE